MRHVARGLCHIAGIMVFGLFAGCGPDTYELEPGETMHPDANNVPPSDASVVSADTLPGNLSNEALLAWRRARVAMLDAETVLRLGSEEEGPDLFGVIGDAQLDDAGNIFVLDAIDQEVRIFDAVGMHLGLFGGSGEGPMELPDATRLAVLGDGRVAVPTGRTAKVFKPSDGEWELDAIQELPAHAAELCASETGPLFFSAWDRDSNTVLQHSRSPGDGPLSGFGNGYQHDDWLVKMRMSSDGPVGCGSGRVVHAFQVLPIVRAYAEDGSRLWTSRLTEYLTMGLVSRTRSDGRTSVTRLRHLDHEVSGGVHVLPSEHVLLQTFRFKRRRRDDFPRTYLLDGASGGGALIGDTIPVISSIRNGKYIAIFLDPYPYLEVRVLSDGFDPSQ